MDNEAAKARFDDMQATYTPLIHALADRTWQKIRHGRRDFVRCKDDQGQWHVAHDRPLDCRYATLSQLTDRKIDWTGGGVECWSAYLDQALSYHVLPDDPHTRVEIAARVERIRAEIDQAELTALLADLPPVDGVDHAPLEMLFVN